MTIWSSAPPAWFGLSLCATMILSPPARAEDWRDLTRSDAPSRLVALAFPGGGIIDVGHSLTWGAWTVSISPSKSAVVDSVQRGTAADIVAGHPDEPTMGVDIKGLICSNSLKGSTSCNMSFMRLIKAREEICVLSGGGVPAEHIECPVRIQLAR
jgi:hypothetical protein